MTLNTKYAPETTRVSDLATQAITTNEQATKYMGRKRVSTKLPDAKLTYSLWVLAIASMSKYI